VNPSPQQGSSVAVIVGTRPEAIKLAPLIVELQRNSDLRVLVINSGQHEEVVERTLMLFGVVSDARIELKRKTGDLNELSSLLIRGLSEQLVRLGPSVVVVQGDTTTALSGAIAAFHLNLKIAHVEAGLRTSSPLRPFPEEMNRRLIGRIASLHLAPTELERVNLLNERVLASQVVVTGNTSIDAALSFSEVMRSYPPEATQWSSDSESLRLLVTMHRRENWGATLRGVAELLRDLSLSDQPQLARWRILWSLHPNPAVALEVRRILEGCPMVDLIAPVEYPTFVHLMEVADLILTDSGGIQEEAPALGTPCLVVREETERELSVACGVSALVGGNLDALRKILAAMCEVDRSEWVLTEPVSPYGDGKASSRSAHSIMSLLGERSIVAEFEFGQSQTRLVETNFSRFVAKHLL
jgi:UDP-N-acetylglucosamine 2-epimerase (non-hydrolysing)